MKFFHFKLYKMPIKSVLILSATILLSLKFASPALATIYQPGETLNPACSPADSVCRVATPAASGANSDITSLSGMTTPLPVSEGGIGLSSVPTGGLIYGAGSNTFATLAIGTTSQLLTVNGSGLPVWATVSGLASYDHWSLQTNGAGTTSISSTNTVNFVNGVGVSLSQSGSAVTVNIGQNVGTTSSPTFTGLSLINSSNQLSFGSNGSKTTITASAQSTNRVVTLPVITANDTFVLNNDGAILTNKTLDANNNTISNLTTSNLSAGASIANSQLANSSITIGTAADSGLLGGGIVSLGGTLNLSFGSSATPGTYGSATQIPILTLNQYGSVTGVTPTTISGLTNSNLSVSAGIINTQLANSSIYVNAVAGSGIGVSNSPVSLGGDLKIYGIDATTTTKGVASFDATNFSVTSGAVDTIQNINTAATPTFNSTTLTNRLFVTSTTNQLSLGATNTTTISATAPGASRTAIIPGLTINDTFAFIGQTQTFTNKTIDAVNNTISGLSNSNLSGSAGIIDANLATISTANKVSGSAIQLNANGGIGDSGGLSLIRTCSNGQLLKWTPGGGWACANDDTSGIPSVYSDGGLLSDSGGLSLIRTCSDGQLLKWTSATGWTCESDNVGGGTITVKESDGNPSVSPVTVLQFGPTSNSSDEFIVSDIGTSIARVRTGNKVVLTDASQTLTNKTISAIGNTITSLTNANLLSGSAAITDNNLSTITTANKVSGSAVQLASGSGLTNNSGLSLLTTCTDGDMLTWNSGTSSWVCTAGDTNPLNTITSALSGNTISNADFAQVWNWSLTTAAKTAFTFGENVASVGGSGSQYILGVSTRAGSTAAPLKVVAQNNTIIDTTALGGLTLGSLSAGQDITVDGGVGTINLGASANPKVINIGAADGSSALNLSTGTGGFSLNGVASTNYSIGTSTVGGTFTFGGISQTGTVNFFTGNGGMDINLGTGQGANNINIGNSTTTTSIQLLTGTGNILTKTANGNGMQFVTNNTTDDSMRIATGLNGGSSSFQGTITQADLSAARTWTLPNASGAVPLSTLNNGLFFTTSGNTTLTLPTSGTVTALGNSTTGSGSTLVLSTTPTFNTSIITPLIYGGALANNTLTLSGSSALSGNNSANANIKFNVGNSGATTAMTILNDGYVGIGTTNPQSNLDIFAGVTTNNTALNVIGSIDDFLQMNIQNTSGGTGAQSGYAATADNGNNTINFMWMGINNSNFNNPQTYNVGYAGDANILGLGNDLLIANGTSDKKIIFYTGGTADSNRRLTIDGSGNVGIGTTTPGYALDIAGAGSLRVGGTFVSVGSTNLVTNLNANYLNGIDSSGFIGVAQTGVISIGTGAANNTINIGTTFDGSTTNITSGTGNINFNVGGNNISGKVIIGNSGTTTPDLLVLDNGTTDPAGTNGATYYNTTLNKFRCFENSAWKNCGATSDLQHATSYPASDANFSIGTGTSTVDTVSITPSTTTGDVYVRASGLIVSGNNTDQVLTVTIKNGTCAGGTTVATNTVTVTVASAIVSGNFDISGVVTNPGTSALTFSLCASATGQISNLRQYMMTADVIDTGADLAEIYTSNDNSLEPGDVVSFDSNLNTGMKKSQTAYDSTAFGIITTKPGIVIGNVESEGTKALPVALSGRVPVKVNTENGPIDPGDYLTSSSTPGVAMKATKAGTIIGQAMTSYNGQSTGKVITFVKNGSFNGTNSTQNLSSNDILFNLIQQNTQLVPATVNLSEINTDKAVAGVEMISPKITTQDLFAANASISGTLTANNIKATSIEGLNQIIDQKINNLIGTIKIASGSMTVKDFEASGSAVFKGSAEFKGPAIFKTISEFIDTVIFHNRVIFADKDMGGVAIIKQSTSEIEVKFDKPYEQVPIINVSLVYDGSDSPTFVDEGKKYTVAYLNRDGFKIILSNIAARDFKYNWIALAVKDVKTSVSSGEPAESIPTPAPIPTLVPTPTPTSGEPAQSAPTPTEVPTATPTPQI